ncbi:hypothetical protein RvY_03023 [Ramazzottius varieornatus]|uniref:Uncharacterized protein n=1 Tax=Ramazzottius varieornatus TaxID=947166 RepID=A0A1D1ULQ7_RAMVA|nr:hypothetical protein RvY_03023 [Ramazzottius varieornatus]
MKVFLCLLFGFVVALESAKVKEVYENVDAIKEWLREPRTDNATSPMSKAASTKRDRLRDLNATIIEHPHHSFGSDFDHKTSSVEMQADAGMTAMKRFESMFPREVLRQILDGKNVKVTLERETKLKFERRGDDSSSAEKFGTRTPKLTSVEQKQVKLIPPANSFNKTLGPE